MVRFSVTVAAAMLFSAHLNAALVSQSHAAFGNDSLTLDTATGLQFLDLTHSRNMSFDQVSAQLGPGGTFDGFRYATLSEVQTLFTNAGITKFDVGTTGAPENYVAADTLLDHLGVLSVFNNSTQVGRTSNGFVAPLLDGSTVKAIHVSIRETNGVPSWGRADLNFFSPASSFQNNSYGSYLVATPEPSALAPLGCLALAVLVRRRRATTPSRP